jgi:hypothetical protein
MKPLRCILLLFLLTGAAVAQPDRDNLYSAPGLPPGDVLERLNLKLAWTAFAPMDNKRDGLLSVQVAPTRIDGKVRMRLLVQTRSGVVVEFDGETGEQLWRLRVGNPGTAAYGLGYNSTDVAAVRGPEVYGISRIDGSQRWKLTLRAVPAATPLMDSKQLYLNMSTDRVEFYGLPARGEPTPILARTHRTVLPLQLEPAQSDLYLFYPSPRGSVSVLNKDTSGLVVRFETGDKLSAGPGVHEAEAGLYIGSRDANVYGYSLIEGEAGWRFTTGTAVDRKPFVNDDDVYATANQKGLFRLNRRGLSAAKLVDLLQRRGLATLPQVREVLAELKGRAGDPASILSLMLQKRYLTENQKSKLRWRGGEDAWVNPEGDRVIAVNPKFVYAMDTAGRLLVIDRERGRTLSRYDMHDYPAGISNEWTDRLFMGAHNGLIICLHDREYVAPVKMKSLLEPPVAPPKDPKAPKEAPPAPGAK